MAQTSTFHIEIDEGSDYTKVFYLKDTTTNIATNLTGYICRMDIRGVDFSGQSTLVTSLSYSSATSTLTSGLTLGGVLGTISLVIPAADTLGSAWVSSDNATYDIFLISPAGVKTKYIKGFFVVKPSTTKLI